MTTRLRRTAVVCFHKTAVAVTGAHGFVICKKKERKKNGTGETRKDKEKKKKKKRKEKERKGKEKKTCLGLFALLGVVEGAT